jgi:hypothetical protein
MNDPAPTFPTVEAAWFWTMARLAERREGRIEPGSTDRVDQAVKLLDRLYRQGKIHLGHARVLRVWCERSAVPDPDVPSERYDAELWREAIQALDEPMRVAGIVERPAPPLTPRETAQASIAAFLVMAKGYYATTEDMAAGLMKRLTTAGFEVSRRDAA